MNYKMPLLFDSLDFLSEFLSAMEWSGVPKVSSDNCYNLYCIVLFIFSYLNGFTISLS